MTGKKCLPVRGVGKGKVVVYMEGLHLYITKLRVVPLSNVKGVFLLMLLFRQKGSMES